MFRVKSIFYFSFVCVPGWLVQLVIQPNKHRTVFRFRLAFVTVYTAEQSLLSMISLSLICIGFCVDYLFSEKKEEKKKEGKNSFVSITRAYVCILSTNEQLSFSIYFFFVLFFVFFVFLM